MEGCNDTFVVAGEFTSQQSQFSYPELNVQP